MRSAAGSRMRTALANPLVPTSAVVDALRAAGFEVAPPQPACRVVLDTFDGRLHAAGLRLEHHAGPPAALHLWGGSDAPAATLDRLVAPAWPADLPAGPFRARLASVTRERALLPMLTVHSRVQTARRRDRRGKTVAIVEVHEAIVIDPDGGDGPSSAVEVTGVVGHDDAADAALLRLRSLGLEEPGGDLAQLVAGDAVLRGYDDSPTVPLQPDDDALAGYRRVLANLCRTAFANLQGTIDDVDPEFLHDLRVAVRRTRSVLGQAKGVLPREVRDQYRDAFGWLGQVTGPPRDLDVYLLGWEAYVAPLHGDERASLETVRAALATRQRAAHRELSAQLTSERARTLLDGWQRWLTDPDVDERRSGPIGPVVAKRIAAAQATVLRDGRRIQPDSPGERLHDLRKDAKKLRYLLECFGGLFPSKPRKAFVGQLKALQDNLGEHQDAEVHFSQLRVLARELHDDGAGADVLLAMGRLSDQLERRRREERDAFAARFAAYDTKANRRALEELIGEVQPS
jgi:CHAD domain-containing protein